MSRESGDALWNLGDGENSSAEFSLGGINPPRGGTHEFEDDWEPGESGTGSWAADGSEDTGYESGEAEAVDAGIAEALDGEHRADELRAMVAALRARADRLNADLCLATEPDEQERLRQHLQEVEEQIQVLSEEANIVRFVEDSVRFSHQVRRLSEG